MSQRDKDFLNAARLSVPDAADALGVTPQAIYQGLKRTRDYLILERLTKLARHAVEKDPALGNALQEYLRDNDPQKGISAERGAKVGKIRVTGLLDEDGVSSLWVFSSSPLELEGGPILEEIKAEFFSKPNFSVVYFVPPRVSLKLRGVIESALLHLIEEQNLNPADLAYIEIVECAAIDLVPHFAIANPLATKAGLLPRGAVVVGEGGEEARLPARQVSQILQVLYGSGIGVDSHRVVPESARSEWDGLSFRSIFNSRELQKKIRRHEGAKSSKEKPKERKSV